MVIPRDNDPDGSCNLQQCSYQGYAADPRATEGTDGIATKGTSDNQAADEKNK